MARSPRLGTSGTRCSVAPSYATNSQSVDSDETAFLSRVTSAAVKPAIPPLSWTRRTSMKSAFDGLMRIIMQVGLSWDVPLRNSTTR